MDEAGFPRRKPGAILTPEAPGLAALRAALRSGCQIRTRQGGGPPVSTGSGPASLIACETSGSSGRPKVILRRAASWRASFDVTRHHHGIGRGDRYAALGPLGHSITLYAMLEGHSLGADLALLAPLSARRQARAMCELGITVLYATPAQLHLLGLGARAAGIAALPRLRLVMTGGGPFPGALRETVARLCPDAAIRHFYGTSETSFVTWTDADTPEGSVGRAYPGVDLRLGAQGEIRVRSPYLFEGYETAEEPGPRRSGRFLATGEIGHLDAAGFLHLRGRADRMITVADRKVFPEQIEAAVSRDPAVQLCAVIARPDPRRGHRIVCVVQGAEDGETLRRLRRRCRDEIGAEAVPHSVVFVPRLPLLPAGKPDLARLAQALDSAR